MCYKPTIHIHNCQHPPLLPVLIQLFFVLLVPQLMGVSVPRAEQYVCPSSCVQMELLHVTGITHLLLSPTLTLHMKVKIGTYTYLQSFLQFNLCMYMHMTSLMHQPLFSASLLLCNRLCLPLSFLEFDLCMYMTSLAHQPLYILCKLNFCAIVFACHE